MRQDVSVVKTITVKKTKDKNKAQARRADQLVGGGRVRQRHHHVVAACHELVQLVRREHLPASPTVTEVDKSFTA